MPTSFGKSFVAFVFLGLSCAFAGGKGDPVKDLELIRANRPLVDFSIPVSANEIKIMNYNVLNLFDTDYDPNTKDYTFIPKSHPMKAQCASMSEGQYKKDCEDTDWTPERLEIKLNQIAKAVATQGVLPDIMTLQEVENSKVVGMLASKMGYRYHITTQGLDPRGIDVALMFNDSKFKYLNHEQLEVKTDVGSASGGKPTRPILVVRFELPGVTKGARPNVLAVYVNHWPSQAAPAEKRVEVAKQLKDYIVEHRKSFGMSNYFVVAQGDFNTVEGDHPHPFYNVIEDPSWSGALQDVFRVFRKSGAAILDKQPLGTYFYVNEYSWQRLDRFFVSQNLVDGAGIDYVADSYRTVADESLTRRVVDGFSKERHTYGSVVFGAPWRFNYNATSEQDAGYSDHFPIVMKLRL